MATAQTRPPAVAGSAPQPSALHPDPPGPPNSARRTTQTATVAPGQNTSNQRKYLWQTGFDHAKIATAFTEKFQHINRYDSRSIPNLQALLTMIEADATIRDIRWMAYMLATAYWETSHIETETVSSTDRRGRVITRNRNYWVNMTPAHETGEGAGRRYERPVKVLKLPSGKLTITEWNGNAFTVNLNGTFDAVVAGTVPGDVHPSGTPRPTRPSAAYVAAQGTEHAYFGRGYCQLTWWYNYATASALMNQGLDYVIDPEKVMVPQPAYDLMSLCMREGKGFARPHKLADYFSGADRKYTQARAMINAGDNAATIATIAEAFEDVLWEARNQ